MTQSEKPRQLEAGEWLHDLLGPTISPCEWARYLASAKAIYARAEAACIAKGREEGKEELRRSVVRATDLENWLRAVEAKRDEARAQLAALQAAAPRWIPTSERLPEVGELAVGDYDGRPFSGRVRMVAGNLAIADNWSGRYVLVAACAAWMPLPPLPSEET